MWFSLFVIGDIQIYLSYLRLLVCAKSIAVLVTIIEPSQCTKKFYSMSAISSFIVQYLLPIHLFHSECSTRVACGCSSVLLGRYPHSP